ncbi:MAG: radical SAM protein [Chloroflexi bacterium]|nr:radical SAM protein [Chloroflexota bacterium]MBT7081057.1 radical SAM protein [Chloroflexota bacterium]MBT7290327.1 radical SAM protein [Chloroflexota bacterium]
MTSKFNLDAKLNSKDDCGVCGIPLIYQATPISKSCIFCGEIHNTNIYCPEGHYVCDSCHSAEAIQILRNVLNSSNSTNPVEILETILAHPALPLHGPEHHSIVPAVIVAAVKNTGYSVPEEAIEQAIKRGTKVPGGWCGFYGACGAAIGVGIAISIIKEATPLTGKPRSLAIEATSNALSNMVDGHPRCCKRSSRRSIEIAIKFLQEELDIKLGNNQPMACSYSERNKECVKAKCAYYM